MLIITMLFLLIPLGTVAQTAGTKPKAATNHSVQIAIEKLVDEYAGGITRSLLKK